MHLDLAEAVTAAFEEAANGRLIAQVDSTESEHWEISSSDDLSTSFAFAEDFKDN